MWLGWRCRAPAAVDSRFRGYDRSRSGKIAQKVVHRGSDPADSESIVEHLVSHLFHLAFGVQVHVPASARIFGHLPRHLAGFAFGVQV
jgi:hypothetical protein